MRKATQQSIEVDWYKVNGDYPERIAVTAKVPFEEYVIGDSSWNHKNPNKQEIVEPFMPVLNG